MCRRCHRKIVYGRSDCRRFHFNVISIGIIADYCFQIRIYFPPKFEPHFEVNNSSVYFPKGVLHTSRAGGPCAAIAQRDAAVWVRDLRENLRTRSEPGSAQSGALAGRPLNWKRVSAIESEIFRPAVFLHFSRLFRGLPRWHWTYLTGEELQLQNLRQKLQALLHAVHAPAHPLGHAALPVPVLREEVPPEVRHEETHVHPHRWDTKCKKNKK